MMTFTVSKGNKMCDYCWLVWKHDSHDASDDWTRCLKISLFPNKSLLTLHIIRNEKTDKNGHFIKFFVQPVILLISNWLSTAVLSFKALPVSENILMHNLYCCWKESWESKFAPLQLNQCAEWENRRSAHKLKFLTYSFKEALLRTIIFRPKELQIKC